MATPGSRARHFRNSPPIATGFFGLAAFLSGFVLWPRGIAGSVQLEFELFLVAIFIVMAIADLWLFKVWRQPEAGIGTAMIWSDEDDLLRVSDKLVGLAAIAAIGIAIYLLMPIYQSPWYQRFVDRVLANGPELFLLALLYVLIVDRIQSSPRDQLQSFGAFIRSFGIRGDGDEAGEFLLASFVKIFFLPLMYCYGLDDWTYFYTETHFISSFTDFYEFAYRFLFFLDVCFAIIGYSLSLRILGSHVRWTDRTVRGWFICLVCYAPFWQVIGREYLAYGDDIVWGSLLAGRPVFYTLWGTAILLLLCVYALSTVAFGLRFSNITYRGTVHRGPYALSRHPAYLAKNATMWMIQIPIIAATPADALSNTLALVGVNAIYLVRARCEAASCREAREYRLYERYMRCHGPLSRLMRLGRRRQPIGSNVVPIT